MINKCKSLKPTHKLTKTFKLPGCDSETVENGSHVCVLYPSEISVLKYKANDDRVHKWPKTPVVIFSRKNSEIIRFAVYELKLCEENGLVLKPLLEGV